jgi:serine/threonine protein kinase
MEKTQATDNNLLNGVDWMPILRKYKLTKCLGKGAFGTVVGGVCLTTGQKVAIKLISDIQTEQVTSYYARKILREILILRKLSEFDDNIFTNKLIDVILPENVTWKKDVEIDGVIEEKQYSDTSKLTHLFLILERSDRDLKKLIDENPKLDE